MKNKRITIKDVARASNTSVATVSRVLNDNKYPVKEDLRKRVIKAANDLNYIPNLIGRQLKKQESTDIGVIIPTISNQYYPQLVSAVEKSLRQHGYNTLLCNSQRKPEAEKKYLESLYQKQVKGIIISSISKATQYHLERLQQQGVNIVAFDQDIDLDCDKVLFDFEKGGYQVAKYLVNNGHESIGFISAPLNRPNRRDVFRGFCKYFEEKGLKIDNKLIEISQNEEEYFDQTYEFKTGFNLVHKFIEKKKLPSALFCINDMTALGVLKGLHENNIRIPEDISVVGFDNILVSQLVNPALTTIDQSTNKMGVLAAEILMKNMVEGKSEYKTIILQPKLVIRQSS